MAQNKKNSKQAKKKTEQKPIVEKPVEQTKRIVDVNCYVKFIGENGAIVEYEEQTFITSKKLLTDLVNGDLKTKEGNESHSLKLGIKEGDEINETDIFLTVKGKSIYFVPDGKTVLIGSVSSFEKFLSGEFDHVRLGKFE